MATRGTISIPEHTLCCPLRLHDACARILFYLYHILSLLLLASVMSGNRLEEGVKSPMGKFLFSLPRPDLLLVHTASLSAEYWNPFSRGQRGLA